VRLLYLNYGAQSGVTAALARTLSSLGVGVTPVDLTERFLWRLRPGSKTPNFRPAVVRAFLESLRAHRQNWKAYWLRTTYSFDHLSELARKAIARARPDAVIQAGVLFGPGALPDVPLYVLADHTWAIAERYAPLPGLLPPVAFDAEWRRREQAVYRAAAGIFSMSEFVKASLTGDYGIDPHKVHVVGAGPNVEPEPHAAPGRHEKAILFVGRNFVPKGGPDLLEAFRLVRRDHPAARLWIVSSSVPGALPEGAVFHGLMPPEALRRLYARASVFAFPTLREAFGLSLVEAMTFGMPVVASRIEAIPEIVSDGETGLLVPPSEPAALAHALCEILGNPVRARAMGAAARALALERFRWELTASRMLAVLRPPRAAAPALYPTELLGA